MKQYTTARRTDTKDLMKMIKLIKSQRAKQRKAIRKFIEKVRAALGELEQEL